MKMEMTISAPEDGSIKSILVRPGEQIAAGQNLIDFEPTKAESEDDDTASEPQVMVDFSSLALELASHDISHQWQVLERDFYSFFTGYDLVESPSQCIHAIERFIDQHPSYKERFGRLLLKSLGAFIKVKRLFQSTGRDKSGMRDTDASECLMHYLLRKDDREKGLPELFLKNLEDAIKLYSWADIKRYEDTTRALFHLYKAQSSTKDSVELIRLSLLYAQQAFDSAAEFTSPEAFSDVINELIAVGRGNTILIDAAIYTRFELIDRAFQQRTQFERQKQVADLLDTVLLAGSDKPELVRDVIESGHQIVSYLVSRYQDNPDKSEMILEFVARRFNRDREFISGQLINIEGKSVYHIKTKKRRQSFDCLVTILSEKQYMESLGWFDKFLNGIEAESLECMVLVNGAIEHSDLSLTGRMLQQPLPVNLCSLGIYRGDDYSYRSFKHDGDNWLEDKSRKFMSPLRYRELRIERLANFDLDLVYHSRYVHVMKLEAKDNPKDERLFGFVEVPETKFDLNDSNVIERINSFEYAILEAVKVLREQQARNKKTYHWNRIIVHIGHTHPLKMDQLGEYPRKITSLIRDIGLEKIVIYTKVEGRKHKEIEAEVLVEKFSTNFNVRGRLPSRKLLQPLDPYTSKVVKSLRMDSPYPYEVIAMLTSRVGEDLPVGSFEEFDIKFDSNGNQVIVSVKGRMPGQNLSNVVFGIIENKDPSGLLFKRVMLLGDPSKDLGSLAERECRRVIAALDLAERENLPIEWIPVSSGAAIDLNTGTENLDWTARVLKRIIEFTQKGGEINIIVAGINVGAQAYWNAEATMLMHARGVLIMTETGSMVLTGKKALDFSGSVSAEDNIGIGGVEQIMAPNGQAQYKVHDIADAYRLLFTHYRIAYVAGHHPYGTRRKSNDAIDRNVCEFPYEDRLNQGFKLIGDIIGEKNKERKKPFDMRQIMHAVRDQDSPLLERWHLMKDAETAIVWETQVCGYPVGLLGFESQSLKRYGDIPNDGPDNWTGGTLYPQSSKKIAKAINAFSGQMPVVVLANLSGFDGSPESLRKLQLEYGAEIGRAVVNFKGPLIFIVISRYHGGAYVVFSKSLNPNIRAAALKSTFASVIGGAPAAAVVFPRQVLKNTFSDPQIIEAQERLKSGEITKVEYDDIFQNVHLEQQSKMAHVFEGIHTVERAQKVGSIDDIIGASELRPYIYGQLSEGIKDYAEKNTKSTLS
jgi:acetyl-CoA carboxylase carboxyltransferase component